MIDHIKTQLEMSQDENYDLKQQHIQLNTRLSHVMDETSHLQMLEECQEEGEESRTQESPEDIDNEGIEWGQEKLDNNQEF
mmetsp:Transcript_20807/g.32103  ORF Transcript_20807/g.32103 Transcript_20807/m.32103 type:complete len:81 (+) Transcript_20807:2772-3014(+)